MNEPDIPVPVRFNSLKHHRNYLLSVLELVSEEQLGRLLDPVCNNYVDVYTGRFSPEEIVAQVLFFLQEKKVFEPENFKYWLDQHAGFQRLRLDDESEWIVRLGNEADRYIHLHPSRNGLFTVRLKGSTLKTNCLLKKIAIVSPELVTLETVNLARAKTSLSPVRKLDWNKGILWRYRNFFAESLNKNLQ